MSQYFNMYEMLPVLSDLFNRFADKHKTLKGKDKNGIVFDKSDDERELYVTFATYDDIDVRVDINITDLLDNGQKYIEASIEDLVTFLGVKRIERHEQESMIILASPAQRQAVEQLALH